MFIAQLLRHSQGQIATGRITEDNDILGPYPFFDDKRIRRQGVIQCGRVFIFRCQLVIYHIGLSGIGQDSLLYGNVTVGIRQWRNISAAMEL